MKHQAVDMMKSVWGAALLLFFSGVSSYAFITYHLREEQPPNTLVGNLASDQGLPTTGYFYKLEEGAPYLRVDGKTGNIYTTEVAIDRETLKDCRHLFEADPCYLEFAVSITDQKDELQLIRGHIEIMDENDNTPQFPSPIFSLDIPKNTKVGTLFFIPVASDKDVGSNGIKNYSLSASPNTDSLFSLQVAENLDEKFPQLIVLGNLDQAQRNSYDLNIKVEDGGNPPRSSSAILRITVTNDTNDNMPKFECSHYDGELAENSPVGHSILQVKANNSGMHPNGEVTYSLHQPPPIVQVLLNIDRNTGIIYVKSLVDREENKLLRFYVQAKNNSPWSKSSNVLVTITVKDINDNAPSIRIRGFGLVPYKDGVLYLSEELPVGIPVALVDVSDRDEGENALVTCILAGDVSFQLQSISDNSSKRKYFLESSTQLDYERIKEYRIEIVALDSGSPALSSTISLEVHVLDMNDNSPIFSSSMYEVDIVEENLPGDKLLDVVATDADSGTNAELMYSIKADYNIKGLFEIDIETGEVRVSNQLDREQREHYKFHVIAADKGVPIKMGTAAVEVRVLDCNDNIPKFMQTSYSFSVMENMPPLTPVGMVTVSDLDKGENAYIDLSVEPDNSKFMFKNGTDTILSRISFDREKESSYTFRLKAVDRGKPSRSSYVGITINILDENDNAPYIIKPSNSSYKFLPLLMSPGSHVEQVKAEDIDTGMNAELFFTIIGGNPHGLFKISRQDGKIMLAKKTDHKHSGLHRLVVRVSDKGRGFRHTTALVHMFVNETISNVTLVESLVSRSLYTPLQVDIAGDFDYLLAKHRSFMYGALVGATTRLLLERLRGQHQGDLHMRTHYLQEYLLSQRHLGNPEN